MVTRVQLSEDEIVAADPSDGASCLGSGMPARGAQSGLREASPYQRSAEQVPPQGSTPGRRIRSAGWPTTVGGWFLLGSDGLACPCHLPLTVGLLAAVFAGTVAGAFLVANGVHAGLASTAYSVLALVLGWRLLHRSHRQP